MLKAYIPSLLHVAVTIGLCAALISMMLRPDIFWTSPVPLECPCESVTNSFSLCVSSAVPRSVQLA